MESENWSFPRLAFISFCEWDDDGITLVFVGCYFKTLSERFFFLPNRWCVNYIGLKGSLALTPTSISPAHSSYRSLPSACRSSATVRKYEEKLKLSLRLGCLICISFIKNVAHKFSYMREADGRKKSRCRGHSHCASRDETARDDDKAKGKEARNVSSSRWLKITKRIIKRRRVFGGVYYFSAIKLLEQRHSSFSVVCACMTDSGLLHSSAHSERYKNEKSSGERHDREILLGFLIFISFREVFSSWRVEETLPVCCGFGRISRSTKRSVV